MPKSRLSYMPLATYPESVADDSIVAAAGFAVGLGCKLHVTTFHVEIPQVSLSWGAVLIDVPGLVRAAEEKSRAESDRLHGLVQGAEGSLTNLHCTGRKIVLGAALDAAAAEARYFDLAVLPWCAKSASAQDMAQSVVFGSGRPTVLVPPSARPRALKHIAIAWDASRVAARALGDALPLLSEGGRVSVLTVRGEKPLTGTGLAGVLASSLEKRGFDAAPIEIVLGKRTVAEALQDIALAEGAQILAMGGFGHSRVRDFVLGGATTGVFSDLRLPVLLSH